MTREVAHKLLNSTNGRFITVIFTKKDGSLRRLNGRLGVRRHLRGGERTTDPKKFIIVYDVHAKGYRSVNVDTIHEIHMDKVILKIS